MLTLEDRRPWSRGRFDVLACSPLLVRRTLDAKKFGEPDRDRLSHQRWNRVTNLAEGRIHGAAEDISVRKALKSRRFADRDRPGLIAVIVDMRVRILPEMSGQRTRWPVRLELSPFIRKFLRVVGGYHRGLELRPPLALGLDLLACNP